MGERLFCGFTIHPFGDVFRPQEEHRLTCIAHFVRFVAPHNCQNLLFVMRGYHHLLLVIVRNIEPRNLAVSIDRDFLALAVLETIRQFR